MGVAFAGDAGQLTAFVASQDSVVGATKKRVAGGISAVVSVIFRGSDFCGLLVVGCDL